MKHIIRILFCLLLIALASCNPCNNLDCLYSNYNGQFRVMSKADNKDLVFGPASIYDKDSIKFFSLKNSDTTLYETKAIRFPTTRYDDSILVVNFLPGTVTAFIQLNSGDTDTLTMTYSSRDTKCCGTIVEIDNFKLNNSTDLGGNGETREIRK